MMESEDFWYLLGTLMSHVTFPLSLSEAVCHVTHLLLNSYSSQKKIIIVAVHYYAGQLK